ncbi:MAG: cyclic pyranopterin monophosphate synthase MoaC [Firmicutes bacterium]|nr:cyclic pyranopterin monophosphate synthase MoaC [Bacillota bacterium]
MADFSHFNEDGRATMVDVGGKNVTERKAVAVGRILVNEQCFQMIKTGGHKKGDVLGTAQIAGIMAAKKTPDIIPMCHPIMITGANIRFNLNEEDLAVEIEATVKCSGVTGVEMEALTAASAAALTIYDMCKAVQKDMVIDQIHLVSKSGGKSGDFVWGGDK